MRKQSTIKKSVTERIPYRVYRVAMQKVLCIVLFVYFVVSIEPGSGDKSAKLIIDKLIPEIEGSNILQNELNLENKDGEVIVNGQLKQLVDLDNNWTVTVEIYQSQKQDGEYKKLFSLPPKGVCDYMKSYYAKYFYDTLKNHSNAPAPDNCPVIKNMYTVKDYPLDTTKYQNFLREGYYRVIGIISQNDEQQLKYIIECHVEM